MKKLLLTLIAFVGLTTIGYSQGTAPAMPLYANGVPNSKPTPNTYIEKTNSSNGFISLVSIPTLTPFFPEKGKANGTAVVICPGGGYSFLAIGHEGYAVAKEFNKVGVTAFVLKYRLPSDLIMIDKTIGPLQDAQQAILMVRIHAAEWGLNPNKVGIMGFSAGGHLASTAGTHFDKPVIDNKGISVRPDFMILMYPVISFGQYPHTGSRDNLIGLTPTPGQVELYSNEKQVTSTTPITFLVQAQDDKTVPIQNSLLFYEALVKANVKGEMHIYQSGGHGFGLNNTKSDQHWFGWCASWLTANGF
jgi:acetyl esterase/lipase